MGILQMRKIVITSLIFMIFSGCTNGVMSSSSPSTSAQKTVDRSRSTVCSFTKNQEKVNVSGFLNNAHAVVIIPSVIRGGYIGAVDAGSGVLVTKGNTGQWGYPSFYSIGNVSLGFQAGLEQTEMMLFLMNRKAIDAVVRNQFRFGADAGLSVAVWGAGGEGATTTNMGADIIMLNKTKLGLYGGVSLKSGSLVRRKDLNEAYYGKGATPININQHHAYQNQGAESLRSALSGGC